MSTRWLLWICAGCPSLQFKFSLLKSFRSSLILGFVQNRDFKARCFFISTNQDLFHIVGAINWIPNSSNLDLELLKCTSIFILVNHRIAPKFWIVNYFTNWSTDFKKSCPFLYDENWTRLLWQTVAWYLVTYCIGFSPVGQKLG